MTSPIALCLEEKINLIKEKESGPSYRPLSGRFQIIENDELTFLIL